MVRNWTMTAWATWLWLGFNASARCSTSKPAMATRSYELDVEGDNTQMKPIQYYLNCTINIAPGFFVVPEVGMITISSEDAS
jgi:hypothetical protein